MTTKTYLYANPPLVGTAIITAIEPGEHPRVRLNNTIFHAKGGGQLGDKGFLNQIAVIDVRHAEDGEVDHFVASVDGLAVDDTVSMQVDAESRLFNSRLHCAGHLIANVLEQPFPRIKPLQAHHYPGESRVEFEAVGDLVEPVHATLPQLLANAIAANLAVSVEGDPARNRRIRIGQYREIPCGGTHVGTLRELIRVDITAVKMKNGRLRVSYAINP